MVVTTNNIAHFSEYIECISSIGRGKATDPKKPPVLWFRGHQMMDWALRPTLLREIELKPLDGNSIPASGRAVEEELRKQNYIARNYHFLGKTPATDVDWLEVMQHHSVKTRMLDWSESAVHSLLFALECFFDNEKYRTEDRKNCTPCVWILDPINWNMVAFEKILKSDAIREKCIDVLGPQIDKNRLKKIKDRMEELGNNFKEYLAMDSTAHLKGIMNLSSIASSIYSLEREDLVYLLEKGELYFCLFFILTQVYLTSNLQEIDEVLPLSIVEAYHSNRIQAQKGVFTIFPYYKEDPVFQASQNVNIFLDAMENMHDANGFLHKITLRNPDEIAFELMNAGLNVSWLYPEMPVVANAIEKRKIFI